jgi:hypothetical protein
MQFILCHEQIARSGVQLGVLPIGIFSFVHVISELFFLASFSSTGTLLMSVDYSVVKLESSIIPVVDQHGDDIQATSQETRPNAAFHIGNDFSFLV